MKRYLLPLMLTLVCSPVYSQVEKPNIITELFMLLNMQNSGKASVYLTVNKQCLLVSKTSQDGGLYYIYKLRHRPESYGIMVTDNTGTDVSTTSYTTYSKPEYLKMIDLAKQMGYAPYKNTGELPNLLMFAKNESLLMLTTNNNGHITGYTIAASKMAIY